MPINTDFLVLFEFVFFSILFALGAYFASFILRCKSKNKDLNSTYECGLDVSGNSKIKFQPAFFAYALVFLVFEAECALMFPFAYAARALELYSIVEIMVFILILILSLLFSIKSNLLDLNQRKN